MRNFIKATLCTIFVLMPSVGLAQNQLPIQEGSFVRSQADCALLLKGELDFIEFSVGKQGREYTLPEVACVVAEVKKLEKIVIM